MIPCINVLIIDHIDNLLASFKNDVCTYIMVNAWMCMVVLGPWCL